jgi:hypothetical protein
VRSQIGSQPQEDAIPRLHSADPERNKCAPAVNLKSVRRIRER